MNTKELKQGNYVVFKRMIIGPVTSINDQIIGVGQPVNHSGIHRVGTIRADHLEPVPLTKEWVMKFGLEKLDTVTWRIIPGILLRSPEVEGWDVYKQSGPGLSGIGLRTIKYVHQLQNIYHALTDKELIWHD